MHLIAYTSTYTGDASRIGQDLMEIVGKSKVNNPQADITGVLFFQGGQFLQFIEGEIGDLEILMARIELDSRHRDLVRVVDEPIVQRGFSSWNMDAFNLDPLEELSKDRFSEVVAMYKNLLTMRTEAIVSFVKSVLADDATRKQLVQ